jgi:hypothetical protein
MRRLAIRYAIFSKKVRTIPCFSLMTASFRSLRLRRKTLRAMRPIAIIKVATAATESPAIIVRGGSAVVAGCTVGCRLVEVDEVGEEEGGIESAMTELVLEGRCEGVLEVIVGLGVVEVG